MAPPESERTHEAWCRRLNLLSMLLHLGSITTDGAARFLGVDRRAARGDLDALEPAGQWERFLAAEPERIHLKADTYGLLLGN